MRRSNTQTLGEVIREYLKTLDIENKLNEVRLIDSWPEIVGTVLAKRTSRLNIKNRVLFVSTLSSVVRSELLLIRQGLVKALNEKAGASVIDEIVFR
jgi:predicted nucleic acid-binding Zn ribbon protein